MKKQFLLPILIILFVTDSYGQQFPQGTCGTANLYDANGNRRTRKYFCNNGSNYPQRNIPVVTTQDKSELTTETPDNQALNSVLYPNPTTGQFYISFERELKSAKVTLIDMNGKTIQQLKANSTKLSFDLTGLANGVYIIRIEEKGKVTIKKVIKQ